MSVIMLWCIFTTADSAHRSPTAESITTRNEPRAIGQDDETGRLVKGAKAFGGPKGRTGSIMS